MRSRRGCGVSRPVGMPGLGIEWLDAIETLKSVGCAAQAVITDDVATSIRGGPQGSRVAAGGVGPRHCLADCVGAQGIPEPRRAASGVRTGSGARDAAHPGPVAVGAVERMASHVAGAGNRVSVGGGSGDRGPPVVLGPGHSRRGRRPGSDRTGEGAGGRNSTPRRWSRRHRKAVSERRVTTRPAPDSMAYLSVLMPVEQAVCLQATLGRDADSLIATGNSGGRTRNQLMVDLLFARGTGACRGLRCAGGGEPGAVGRDTAGRWARGRRSCRGTGRCRRGSPGSWWPTPSMLTPRRRCSGCIRARSRGR